MGYQPQTSTPQGYLPQQQSAQQAYQPQSTPQGYQPQSRSEYAAPYALTPQSQNPSGARTALEQAGVYMVMRQPPQHHQPSHQQQLHQQHQVQQLQMQHQQQHQTQHYVTQGLQGPWTSRPQGPPPQAPLQGTRPPSPVTVPPATPVTQHQHQQPPTAQGGMGAPSGEVTGSGAPGDRIISGNDRPDGVVTTTTTIDGDSGIRPASQAGPSSGHSSECEKGLRSSGRSSCNVDSGRGSANCSSGGGGGGGGVGGGTTAGGGGTGPAGGGRSRRTRPSSPPAPRPAPLHDRAGEWVDAVENELRAILSPGAGQGGGGGGTGATSTGTGGGGRSSESLSSLSPPLPPLGASPPASPRAPRPLLPRSLGARVPAAGAESSVLKGRGPLMALPGVGAPKHRALKHALSAGALGDSGADATSSTWTGLEDEDASSDGGGGRCDARALRRQLTALERMYAEVLALLGGGGGGGRRPMGGGVDRRGKAAHGGSLSSLPSSASSLRPLHRERRRDDRRKARDLKGVGRRFQRLEAHVVTLARSVAHLSSEMRTQHLVMQEMESIRSELASLRVGGSPAAASAVVGPPGASLCALPVAGPGVSGAALGGSVGGVGGGGPSGVDALGDPARLRRLTKFFGDEPPLLRLFLQRLGYERYAGALEAERVGLLELPFVGDERLQRLGIPLGPRARILAEAQRTLVPSAAAAAAHAGPGGGGGGGHGVSNTLLASAADKVVPAAVVAAGGVGPKAAGRAGACIRSDQFYSDH